MPLSTAHRAVRSGEVTLAASVAGDMTGPPVVLIHGYPDTQEMWVPVVDRLAADFRVITYDVRGAGASSAPRGRAAYDLSCLADDFQRVCADLAPERPVHLVGHDWGGVQGWEFVTAPRFAGRIASFTTIAGPALAHAVGSAWAASPGVDALRRLAAAARHSWYIAPLCLPGGPTLLWRVLLAGGRWRRLLAERERLALDAGFPAPTLGDDGLHGANLYRQNIPRRLIRPPVPGVPHAPVQLIVPTGDRFIPESYYEAATRISPTLRRRDVAGSHWAPRTQPAAVAGWITEFARENESSMAAA